MLHKFARYKNNINAILNDQTGVNLGAVYETVVAQELKCHGHTLYYYDRKGNIVKHYENLSRERISDFFTSLSDDKTSHKYTFIANAKPFYNEQYSPTNQYN